MGSAWALVVVVAGTCHLPCGAGVTPSTGCRGGGPTRGWVPSQNSLQAIPPAKQGTVGIGDKFWAASHHLQSLPHSWGPLWEPPCLGFGVERCGGGPCCPRTWTCPTRLPVPPPPPGSALHWAVACPLSSSFTASPPSPSGSPWVGELDASPGYLILSCSSQRHTFGPMWAWGLVGGSQDVPAGCPFRGHYLAHPSCHPPFRPPFPSLVLVLPHLHLPQARRQWAVFGPRGPSASLYN